MAITLFDATLFTARLQSQVTALKKIGVAVDLETAAEDAKNKVPAAWVFPTRETPFPNATVSIVSQKDVVRFAVLLAVTNRRDVRGEQAQADLKPLREAVMTALLGWTPSTEYDVVQYGGGRMLKLDAPVLWWQDEFLTSIYLRSA